jgi:hypothetical protein
MKKTGRDEIMWVVIHICMETIQGISLYSYLYLKLVKNAMFFFLSFMFFSATKSDNKRAEQDLLGGGEERGGTNNVYTCK